MSNEPQTEQTLQAESAKPLLLPQEGLLWTPMRTRPRQEKKLAEYCLAHNIQHYLPLRRKVRRYQRRNVEFMIPMFPSYVFAAVDEKLYQDVLRSGRVAFRIKVDDKSESGLLRELRELQMLEKISVQQELVVKPELVPGVPVEVKSGPLRGINGIVVRRKNKTMVAVNIELLGQSVAAEVDVGDLELDA